MQLPKISLQSIAILALFIYILYLQQCSGGINKKDNSNKPTVIVNIDTSWLRNIVKGSTSTPSQVRETIPYIIPTTDKETIYKIDSSSQGALIRQVQYFIERDIAREQKLNAKNIYSDTFLVDTGINKGTKFWIKDTTQFNLLGRRSWGFDILFPKIEKTTTITNPPKRQFYSLIGLNGNQQNFIYSVEMDLLYKDRRDRIIGAKIEQPVIKGFGTTYGIKVGKKF